MRSQFLTLLCVLTFISCGWGIVDATIMLLQTDSVAQTTYIEQKSTSDQQKKASKEYYEDRSSGNVPLPDNPELIRKLAIGQLIYALITLVGAVLMFRLRRFGFWVYIAGVAVGLILPIALAGFEALNLSFGVFFSVLFVMLYRQTLKEMH